MFHGLSLILLQQIGFSRRNSFKVTHRGRFEHEPAKRPPMRGGENYVDQKPRTTESAAMARLSESSKNSSGWPMNMPSATKALTSDDERRRSLKMLQVNPLLVSIQKKASRLSCARLQFTLIIAVRPNYPGELPRT